MDINDILDDQSPAKSELIINQPVRDLLAESARWGRFISIVGFILLGLGLIGTLLGGSLFLSFSGGSYPGFGILGMFLYALIICVIALPVYFLYSFATKTQVALRDDDQAFLVDAFANLRSLFKFYGIFMIIALAFYALGFVVMLFGLSSSGF